MLQCGGPELVASSNQSTFLVPGSKEVNVLSFTCFVLLLFLMSFEAESYSVAQNFLYSTN